ncbi:hypothetical protein MKQ68_22300 [Chitinophaga horti]|uniref:Uncharacterized protein n=1 Tax=Chitinophaga horti TaxID=2920382 RepID=A0ABY6J399_9BACT|nr:hypothetical protein [Chitinophaga horti]UYQ92816.1 hypothetical protein MKQ68_22300 [Chitinophaga horti]
MTIRVPVGKNVEVERDAYDLFFWDRGRWRGDRISWDDFEDNDRVQLRMDHDGIDNLNREERRKADEKRVEEEKRNEEERVRREQQKTDTVKPDAEDNRYRYKRDQPAKVDTVRPDATAMTPVDNSDEPSRSQRGTLVAMETASFLFRMYRN